ncbi:glutamate 5-kinase [Austwickia chelonae]|uniref:Glutamate 5-kinase n=1 Tax=Austwickia chelonae NBRC 105200 TaxID=1184607 RepID=K6V389_9MICO|nr:glutamate 5-kinase [Austwickia chelonae]GAB76498.1 glutamate 5-kinase [Austwickia chelonae NBRC 105200]SEW25772.1 glutamate 5-kinase [Austwickia chelonae]
MSAQVKESGAVRRQISRASRLVVKVGSSSLTTPQGILDAERLRTLADALAERRLSGHQVVLVSSGAIAAGIVPLGLAQRPRDLATQQAAASVGQGALVAAYTAAFGEHGLTVGQILLAAGDLNRSDHYVNARRAIVRLLRLGVLPVVNENDAVATDEIRFGDNDRLAALVAHLIGAEALVLLTDTDALYDGPPQEAGSRRIRSIADDEDLVGVRIGGSGSAVGTGGMVTKIEAARIATGAGIPTLLAGAVQVTEALRGDDLGTLFLPRGARPTSKRLWLAHASEPEGRLVLDEGAVEALCTGRASLLPAGVVAVEGAFAQGAPVELVDRNRVPVARGLVAFSSDELPRLLGRSTRWLGEVLGPQYARDVVNRDYLVLL